MRAVAFIVCAFISASLHAQPMAANRRGGYRTLWENTFTTNGVPAATPTYLPGGFPTPAILWSGWADPLVNYGSGGGTFALSSGATTAVPTPFCPTGNFSDLTNATNCMQARDFDGTNYYEISNSIGDINSTSLSACAVFRDDLSAAVNYDIAGKRDDTDDEGWSLRFQGNTGYPAFYIETTTGNVLRTVGGSAAGYWTILCGTANVAGNVYAYNNGTISSGTAYPAGTSTTATPFRVGTTSPAATAFNGAILAVYVWPGVALTSTQVRQFTQYWEGVLPKNSHLAADNTTTSGNGCYWYGANISCLSDDFLPVGASIPPGLTGGGTYGGILSTQAWTNLLLQSRDPSASWTLNGVNVLGAPTTADSPFLNGWAVTPVIDDDATGAEYMAQAVDMTALSTNSNVTVQLYARAVSGTAGIDYRIYEDTGGSCTTAQTDYDAVALTTTWTTITRQYVITDGDCTSFILYVGPVSDGGAAHDFADAAETGSVYVLAAIYFNSLWPNPMYIETTTASAVSGKTLLSWKDNASLAYLQAGAGYKDIVSIDVTPMNASPHSLASAKYIWEVSDGTSTNFNGLNLTTAGKAIWSETGTTNAPQYTYAWTAGTTYALTVNIDWGADIYELVEGTTSKDTDSAADSPTTPIDSLAIGDRIGGSQNTISTLLKNFKIRRRN